ncbi:MAG: hypothetical protein EPO28_03105 [Saprospiraceae bacterium]|nr:MAG: hypothetical protein EPO28_03105 [Saprospiraceae bacterium]
MPEKLRIEKSRVGEAGYKGIFKALSNPGHWHTPIAIMTMQAGKHVYLEKPCCHSPQEGEWLVAAQHKTGKVLQFGNQQRPAPTSMLAKKKTLLRAS